MKNPAKNEAETHARFRAICKKMGESGEIRHMLEGMPSRMKRVIEAEGGPISEHRRAADRPPKAPKPPKDAPAPPVSRKRAREPSAAAPALPPAKMRLPRGVSNPAHRAFAGSVLEDVSQWATPCPCGCYAPGKKIWDARFPTG